MKYERELPYSVNIEDLLAELLEYMSDRSDVNDSETGPTANTEMRFAGEIRQALFQIEQKECLNKLNDKITGMPFGSKRIPQ